MAIMSSLSRSLVSLRRNPLPNASTAISSSRSRQLQPTRRLFVTSIPSCFPSPFCSNALLQRQPRNSRYQTNPLQDVLRHWMSFDTSSISGIIAEEDDLEKHLPQPFFAGIENSEEESLVESQHLQHQRFRYTTEQLRAFHLERERMKQLTERILALQDRDAVAARLRQPSFRYEVSDAFKYWLSRRAAKMEEDATDRSSSPFAIEAAALQGFSRAAEQCKQLLAWTVQYGNPQLIQFVVKTPDSSVGKLVQLINNLLIGFRGTSADYKRAVDYRIRRETSWDSLQQSLHSAAEVCRITQDLLENPNYPKIQPDVVCCNGFLSLWSRQCWLLSTLGERQNFSHNEIIPVPHHSRLKQLWDCIYQIETLVHNMETREDYPKPEENTYNMLVTALVYSSFPESLKRAREVLARMDPPSRPGYNALLWGYAMNAAVEPSYATQARELMFHIQDLANRYPEFKVDVVTHSTVILAYCNAGLPNEAEEYLNEIEQSAEATNIYPNTICYNTVMAALVKRLKSDCLDKIMSLLQRMRNLKAAGMPWVSPDRITYGFVIEAYAKSPSADGPAQAEALLFQTADDEDTTVRPDMITYNKVMSALAKRSVDDVQGAERVERILRRMQKQHEWSPGCYPAPDLASYNCCISAWTNSNASNALQRAFSLLNEVDTAYTGGNKALKPTRVTFNSILATVGRSNRRDAIEKAEAILTRMEQLGVKRDIWTYNTFLDVLARQHGGTGENADRALLILKTMEDEFRGGNESLRPNASTYNTVLKAVGKAGGPDAPIRCERLLQRMIAISQQPGRQDLRPEVVAFTTVLNSWARSGRPDALICMEKLIGKMEGFAKPNLISYNTILSAISRSGMPDAGPRAEDVFRRLQASGEAVAPNNFTFSTIIACWARTKHPGAAERADAYFRKMQQLYKAGNPEFKPVPKTYTSLLDAWSKTMSPHAVMRCLEILDEIEDDANSADFKPNVFTYNAILNCIAKQEEKSRKVARIKEIFERQVQAYERGNEEVEPNAVTFTIMLNACAYSRGTPEQNEESFAYAQEIMQQFRKRRLTPNVITYANFLVCCKNLLPRDSELRQQMAKETFKECCDMGLPSQKLLEVFQTTVSEKVYAESMVDTMSFLDSSFSPLSQ